MAGESSQSFPSQTTTAARPPLGVAFEAHVELLRSFVARRGEIVERIAALLNAQRKPPQLRQDVAHLSRALGDCFFALAGLGDDLSRLKSELDDAHWASGFKPRRIPGQPNDLVDAAELAARAFMMWQRTRWPGHRGRIGYAHTLFDLYLLRRLMLLAMRIWDAGVPSERLAQVQSVLDELRRTTPADRPVFLRDARWLFPLAQSPTTDELHGYFDVAERIEERLPEGDRLEIHKAGVRMAGGHLRSQLRHVATQKDVPLDDPELISSTRRSNALDVATLMQGLVPLLAAYERAAIVGDTETRLELADAICQGVSPDPELFLNRLELLGPYSMIEHLFIETGHDGRAGLTSMGQRHLRLLRDYAALIPRVAKALHDDCARFRPVDGAYSPYGVLYGFSSQLLEHMALKAAQPDTATRFSLEDVFTGGDADKLAWVGGWRKLPHVPREVMKLFEYPQAFAEAMFERIERALRRRAGTGEADAPAQHGRLIVLPHLDAGADSQLPPSLPTQYIVSSDPELVAAGKAAAGDEPQLLHSRLEGEFLVSYETPHGFVGITKDVLTEVLGAGRDAALAGLPRDAARALKLMCPGFVSLAENDASFPR